MEYRLFDVDESYTQLETDDIEFKKKVIDTLSVFVEGYKFDYNFRAGLWDGKKNFYTIEDNYNIQFPKGLVAYIIKDLQKNNLKYSYEKTTKKYDLTYSDFESFVDTLGLPFSPYDYQMDATYKIITEKRLTLRSATSSGKSLIAYLFIMYMISVNKRILLIVPSINLVDQMFSDFEEYGLKNAPEIIKQIGGDHKSSKDLSEKNVVISTWQSLQRITEKEFEIFDGILVDECLDGNSKITMGDDKIKNIKDVKIGEKVKTINEKTKEIEIKEVVNLHKNIPSEDMYEILLEDSKILRVTGNHKLNTKRGWIRVDSLLESDEIVVD